MRFILPVILIFLPSVLSALVSIAPVDIGSQPGFSSAVSGAFASKRGNTDKDEYSLGLRLQYDEGNRSLVWGTVTYEYGESEGTKNEEKAYAHLRYIRALGAPQWCGELFVQGEQDEFKDINSRSLAGAGVRWRFFDSSEWGMPGSAASTSASAMRTLP